MCDNITVTDVNLYIHAFLYANYESVRSSDENGSLGQRLHDMYKRLSTHSLQIRPYFHALRVKCVTYWLVSFYTYFGATPYTDPDPNHLDDFNNHIFRYRIPIIEDVINNRVSEQDEIDARDRDLLQKTFGVMNNDIIDGFLQCATNKELSYMYRDVNIAIEIMSVHLLKDLLKLLNPKISMSKRVMIALLEQLHVVYTDKYRGLQHGFHTRMSRYIKRREINDLIRRLVVFADPTYWRGGVNKTTDNHMPLYRHALTGLQNLLIEDGEMETTKMISLVETLHVIYTSDLSPNFHNYIIANIKQPPVLRAIGVLVHRLVKRDEFLELITDKRDEF